MAVFIEPSNRLGDKVGSGLANVIGGTLQNLAERKAAQVQEHKTIYGLKALGFSPEQASQVAMLPPDIQKEAVKNHLQGPQNKAYASALQQILGGDEYQPFKISESGLNARQAEKLVELGLKNKYEQKKDIREDRKATAKFREKISEQNESAREDLDRYNRIEQLIDKGSLSDPVYVKALQKYGWDVPALLTEDSEELQKLSQDFLRNAKSIYGARITNQELENYLKTVPNLLQSKNGMRRVIRNQKIIAKGKQVLFKTMREIIKENKGNPPFDINEQVQERASAELDKLSKEFSSDDLIVKTFDKPQKASDFPGKKMKFPDGTIRISDGTKWIKES
jgi:hypothetical protein